MKKRFLMIGVLLLALLLVACNTQTTNPATNQDFDIEEGRPDPTLVKDLEVGANDLYLITDLGTIDDKSFNQGSFEGLKWFAQDTKVEAHYIQPTEKSKAAYLDAIERAINEGAKVIVTPGFLFSDAIFEAQDLHPEVKFIFVDGVPSSDGQGKDEKVADNTVSILYHEEQAGYLAGYAMVKEGYTKLGFMGGLAVPAVVNFGYGYVQGANDAAKELGIEVDVRYTYLNSFHSSPDFTTQAAAWYNSGIEVIFAAAGGAGNSVMEAANAAGKMMVGVDVDQKDESPTVLTSAMKNLPLSVYEATKNAYEGKFPGGKVIRAGVMEDMVQLSNDFSRFKKFTKEDYKTLYDRLKANENGVLDKIPNISTAKEITEIKFENVHVELISE